MPVSEGANMLKYSIKVLLSLSNDDLQHHYAYCHYCMTSNQRHDTIENRLYFGQLYRRLLSRGLVCQTAIEEVLKNYNWGNPEVEVQ